MTSVLWQGHEMDAYALAFGAPSETSSGSGGAAWNPLFGRGYISLGAPNGQNGVTTAPDWAPRDELWHRFITGFANSSSYGNGKTIWDARNAAGTPLARIRTTADSVAQAQVWDGFAWVNAGPSFALLGTSNTRHYWHVHFKGGASGVFQIFFGAAVSPNIVIDAAGDYSTAVNLVRCGHSSFSGLTNAGCGVGQGIVQDTPTLGSTTECRAPTSDGTDATGAGTFADVAEHGYIDVVYVPLNAVGDKRSFKTGARTTTQAVTSGLTISARAAYEDGGPTSVRPYLLIGGTRYYGPTIQLSISFAPIQYTWLTNPATGAYWSEASANDAALEWGWEAAA